MSVTRDRSMTWTARTYADFDCVTPGPPPADAVKTRVVTVSRLRTGERNLQWKKQIAQGLDATTPLTATMDTTAYSWGRGDFRAYQPGTSYRWYSEVSGALPVCNASYQRSIYVPNKSTTPVINGASTKFYKQLRSVRQKWSAPTFLGELRETYRMLRRPAQSTYDLMKRFGDQLKGKKLGPRGGGEVGKALGGLWLEYAFGLKPLIQDTKDAATALEELVTRNERFRDKISASFTYEYDRTGELISQDYEQNPAILMSSSRVWFKAKGVKLLERHFCRFRAGLRHELETTKWDNWALFGFTPEEFIPTAWELIPWSFLVDYFTNIGNILSSATTVTRNVAWCNRALIRQTQYTGSIELDYEKTMSQSVGVGWVNLSASGSPSRFSLKRKLVDRSKVGLPPVPSFEFQPGITLGRGANIAALVAQFNKLYPQRLK